jgi:hypothetical protein
MPKVAARLCSNVVTNVPETHCKSPSAASHARSAAPQDRLLLRCYDERDIRDRFIAIGQGKTGQKLRIEAVRGSKAVVDRTRA